MKRNATFIIILLTVFLLLPDSVSASTRCVYTWYTSNATASKEKTILETGSDDNVLTEITTDSNLAFANKELKGIRLNSDGSCPSVSFYKYGNPILIYKNSNCKNNSSVKKKNRKYCTEAIKGELETSDRSNNNISGSGEQYSLETSGDTECTYKGGIKVNRTFTFEYDDGDVSQSCKETKLANSDTKTRACAITSGDYKSSLLSDNKLKCPSKIYVKELPRTSRAGRNRFSFVGVGGESDTDTTGQNRSERLGLNADGTEKYTDRSTIDNLNKSYTDCGQIIDMSEGKFGWLLQKILNYIKIAGPILVVLLSALDFIKAVASSDENVFKKAQNRLVIRLIAALALFLVPTLVTLLLGLINGITDPTCGLL